MRTFARQRKSFITTSFCVNFDSNTHVRNLSFSLAHTRTHASIHTHSLAQIMFRLSDAKKYNYLSLFPSLSTHKHTHSPSLSFSHTQTLSLSLSLSLARTHAHSFSPSLSHISKCVWKYDATARNTLQLKNRLLFQTLFSSAKSERKKIVCVCVRER